MRRVAMFVAATLLVGGLCGAGDQKISWMDNLADGLKAAQDAGKPAFIYFFSPGDGICTKFEETVLGDERVVSESTKFVCIRVDCDKDEAAMKKYGVDSPPACVFAKGSGDKVADLESRDPEKAARQMADVAENFNK